MAATTKSRLESIGSRANAEYQAEWRAQYTRERATARPKVAPTPAPGASGRGLKLASDIKAELQYRFR